MFEDTINARVDSLGVRIGDICDALGWSRSAWGTAKKRSNLNFQTLARLALVLAIPVEILVMRDPELAVIQHVPDWRWLDAYGHWRSICEAQYEKRRDVPVPEWADFQDQFRRSYR